MTEELAPDDERAARTFRSLLVNSLISGVTSSFLWFALTFWLYLETRSVVATAIIGAAFSLSSTLLAPAFGTYVDGHRKHQAMVLSSSVATVCFLAAVALYAVADEEQLLSFTHPAFWLLIALTLLGSVAGSLRSVALSTTVTLLVPEDRRDRANGLVGTITGVSFAITSVFSGLVIGQAGMGWALAVSGVLTTACLLHLMTIHIDEPEPAPDTVASGSRVDIRAAVEAITAVPGLLMLVLLAAFNNLLAGVFMTAMDAYGLSLVSVETWGLLWGVISLAFIAGGLAVHRYGLGRVPVRVVLIGNLVNWSVSAVFTLRSSIVLLTIGCCVWLFLIPVIEAAEQTVLQRAVPYERQGRVFGFAQLVENSAAPVMAILLGPLTESFFMPTMTDGTGARWIGDWFGTGPERGIALLFTLAGLVGIIVTAAAWMSSSYRRLAAAEKSAAPVPA